MRTSLASVAWIALLGFTVACSAAPDEGGALPSPTKDGGKDTSATNDTSVDETSDDTATPPGDAGGETACTAGDIEKRACGACGKQVRACGLDGWKPWEPCSGELPEPVECKVGEVQESDCGNCGKQKDICDPVTCTWTIGSCTGEGECAAGDREETSASCTAPEVRYRTCDDKCKWSAFSACGIKRGWIPIAAPPTTFTGRYFASGVWTGSNAIVWGGYGALAIGSSGGFQYTKSDGASYDVKSDTWTVLPAAPTAFNTGRYQNVAVMGGTKLLIWGGAEAATIHAVKDDGAIYDTSTKSWKAIAKVGNPSARSGMAAVWSTTTNELLVWGGCTSQTSVTGCSAFNANGHSYDPVTDKWTLMPAAPTGFAGRWRPAAVWSGSEMIIWGGMTSSGVYAKDGARYDPKTRTWTKFTDPSLDARYDSAGVFTSKELLVWGGYGAFVSAGFTRDDGAHYLPGGSWSAMSAPGTALSSSKRWAMAAWYGGGSFFVWSGATSSAAVSGGASYDPTLDKWTALPSTDEPTARCRPAVIWTGSEAVVWGGASAATGGTYMANGAIYRP